MTNNEIIISEAIKHGIYTKAEAQAIVAAKGCLPIHTFAEWKKAGYSVKRGEHAAITCDLWKYTERPGKAAKAARAEAAKAGQNGPDADAPDPHYYMAKAHLFTRDQVKPAGQDDAPKAKTPEEIAAYNKKLADERKARKAAQQAAAAPAPAQPAAKQIVPAAGRTRHGLRAAYHHKNRPRPPCAMGTAAGHKTTRQPPSGTTPHRASCKAARPHYPKHKTGGTQNAILRNQRTNRPPCERC